MSTLQYVLGIVAASLTLVLVIEMLRLRRLRERHAWWWLVAGVLALIIAIFPQSLEAVATALGFDVPINLAFFASLILLFLVALQHSTELTKAESRNRVLAEQVAMLDIRVRELETSAPVGDVKNAKDRSRKSK